MDPYLAPPLVGARPVGGGRRPTRRPPTAPASWSSTTGARNLVAMEALLAPLGRRVVLAESGEEALRILLAERFALILLDVQMPGMDGFETARLIRGRLRTRRIPIIFVTAITSATSHMFDGYAAGAVDYLLKPVDPVILRSKVTLFVELFELNARLQREAARRGMEESLALAQRAGLSGVWDWHLPSDRVRWSGEYADLVGLPADAGGDPRQWLATVDPRDRDRSRPASPTPSAPAGRGRRSSASSTPAAAPRWLSARGRVYRDGDGEPERFIGIAMDVTERHRAEEELRRLNATGERLATALTRAEVVAEVVRQARGLPGVARTPCCSTPARRPGWRSPADALVRRRAGRGARAARVGGAGCRGRSMPLGGDGTVLALSRPPRRRRGAGEEVDAGFLAAFAAQCAQALERARLHDAERTRGGRPRRSRPPPRPSPRPAAGRTWPRRSCSEAIRTFGAAAAGVRLLAPDGATLRTVAVGGFDDALARPARRQRAGRGRADRRRARPARRSSPRTRPRWPAPPRRRRPAAARGRGSARWRRCRCSWTSGSSASSGCGSRARGRSGRPSATRSARSRAWRRCRWCAPACTRARPAAGRTPTCSPTSARPSTPSSGSPAGSTGSGGCWCRGGRTGASSPRRGADGGMRAAIGATEPALEGVLRRGGPWAVEPGRGRAAGLRRRRGRAVRVARGGRA